MQIRQLILLLIPVKYDFVFQLMFPAPVPVSYSFRAPFGLVLIPGPRMSRLVDKGYALRGFSCPVDYS